MSDSTTIRWAPSTTIISSRALGPRGPRGYTVGAPADNMRNLMSVTFRGMLTHAGPPVAGDLVSGGWTTGDQVYDSTGQEYIYSAGHWVAVGSGRVLGSSMIATDFVMPVAATAADVPGLSTNFTYDGRPVMFVITPANTSQDQASGKNIQLMIRRGSDSAMQVKSTRFSDSNANSLGILSCNSGPLTAWPSDNTPFVVGTTYNVKATLLSGPLSKAKIFCVGIGETYPVQLYVVTA